MVAIHYAYDYLNRLTEIDQYGTGGNDVAEKAIEFEYDGNGRFTLIERYKDLDTTAGDEVARAVFSAYDDAGRLTDFYHDQFGTPVLVDYGTEGDTNRY